MAHTPARWRESSALLGPLCRALTSSAGWDACSPSSSDSLFKPTSPSDRAENRHQALRGAIFRDHLFFLISPLDSIFSHPQVWKSYRCWQSFIIPPSRCSLFAGQRSLQVGPSPPPSRTTPSSFLRPHPPAPELQRQHGQQAICLTSSSTPRPAKSYSLWQSLLRQRRLSNCQATHCWPITELGGDVMTRAEQWC